MFIVGVLHKCLKDKSCSRCTHPECGVLNSETPLFQTRSIEQAREIYENIEQLPKEKHVRHHAVFKEKLEFRDKGVDDKTKSAKLSELKNQGKLTKISNQLFVPNYNVFKNSLVDFMHVSIKDC